MVDLNTLRARVRRLEHADRAILATRRLGAPPLDAALPWGGLPLGCLHHVADAAPVAPGGGRPCAGGAATAFAALMAARLAMTDPARTRGVARPRPVVWCVLAGSPDDSLYGPGLAPLGLTPGRLLVVRAPTPAAVAWAMEEAARCPDVGAVVGQIPGPLPVAAGRRLTLAAESGGSGAVLLRSAGTLAERVPGAVTRWRVTPAPSAPAPWGEPGPPRWRLSLEQCRNGRPHDWMVEWNHDTGHLDLATDLPDRPIDADAARAPRRSA